MRAAALVRIGTFMNAGRSYGREGGEVSPIGGVIRSAADWRSYEFIKAAAGDHFAKVLLGVSSNAAKWQGKPALEHLAWIKSDASVGLAIWDLQFKGPVWRSKGMGQVIGRIKRGTEE